MAPEFDQHLVILYSALSTPHGLIISTTDPKRTLRDFEVARAKDSVLANLQIKLSRTNPNAEVWIIHQVVPSVSD